MLTSGYAFVSAATNVATKRCCSPMAACSTVCYLSCGIRYNLEQPNACQANRYSCRFVVTHVQ